MKWLTVEEYAKIEGISIPAVYKRVKENRVKSERKFGRIVIKHEDVKV
jgi:predicted DNA-binding transcriptional regulator AlpA